MKLPPLSALLPTGQASGRTLKSDGHVAASSISELEDELARRRVRPPFPLDVFPRAFKPLIADMIEKLEVDRGFVGAAILQAAASAIGAGLRVVTGPFEGPVNLWTCTVGLTSSGKSVGQKILYRPLQKIQAELDQEYMAKLGDEMDMISEGPRSIRKVRFIKDITFESLTKDVFPHNFNGVTKYEDELIKWLDDMDRYRSGKSEQAFWTAVYDASDNYSLQRAGGKVFIIEHKHLVGNVTGTTQRKVLHRFYGDGRIDTGFTFRFLFVLAQEDRVTDPDLEYRLPEESLTPYSRTIHTLCEQFELPDRIAEPRLWIVDPVGLRQLKAWQSMQSRKINELAYGPEKEVRSGIFGKVKIYVSRFAAILKALHMVSEGRDVWEANAIESDFVTMALQLADYFMASNWEAYTVAYGSRTAPAEIMEFLGMLKACHYNQSDLAKRLKQSRQNVNKRYKEYSRDYPDLFNARK